MSTEQLVTVGVVAALEGAFIVAKKVVVPKTFEAFLRADTTTKVSVGGLAGTLFEIWMRCGLLLVVNFGTPRSPLLPMLNYVAQLLYPKNPPPPSSAQSLPLLSHTSFYPDCLE